VFHQKTVLAVFVVGIAAIVCDDGALALSRVALSHRVWLKKKCFWLWVSPDRGEAASGPLYLPGGRFSDGDVFGIGSGGMFCTSGLVRLVFLGSRVVVPRICIVGGFVRMLGILGVLLRLVRPRLALGQLAGRLCRS
jgi:hypothetical protein